MTRIFTCAVMHGLRVKRKPCRALIQVLRPWVDTVDVAPSTTWTATCLIVTAALLGLTADAVGESQLAAGAAGARLPASAHVDFRIIIPPALGLATGAGNRVAITGNVRSVTLAASEHGAALAPASGRNVVLSAPAHGVITQETGCGIVARARNVMVCTASMP